MLMFFLNLFCLFLYFSFAIMFLFLLYYFKALPNHVPIRLKYNPLDFLLDCFKVLSFDLQNFDKDTFSESGIIIYEGMQGSGKTISMVRDVILLQHRFPKAMTINNLGLKQGEVLNNPSQLCELNNGRFGIITSIDEMGIWFNNRDYKHFSDSGMLQVIFENRKVRRCLFGTAQKFMLVDKNIRIQTSEVRSCFTIGGFLTGYVRKTPMVDSEGTIQKYKFKGFCLFPQSQELRDSYDTFLVIKKFNDSGYRLEKL